MKQFAKFGTKKRARYLQLLREGGRRHASARACGISPELVRLYRNSHPEFAAEQEEAEMEANSLVEDALFNQAKIGNVTACQVWLYNRDPQRWKDMRNVTVTGADGGPIEHVVETVVRTREEAAALLARLPGAGGVPG